MKDKDLATRYRPDVGQLGGKRSVVLRFAEQTRTLRLPVAPRQGSGLIVAQGQHPSPDAEHGRAERGQNQPHCVWCFGYNAIKLKLGNVMP